MSTMRRVDTLGKRKKSIDGACWETALCLLCILAQQEFFVSFACMSELHGLTDGM